MLDMMKTTINRNLLKYSAGHAICCPKCGKIADYRQWVIWESPLGQHGAHCADCWREGLALVHDEKPHAYLLSIGWGVTTLVDFDKKPRSKRRGFPTGKKALDAALRRDITANHKRNRYHAKHDRIFPKSRYAPIELIETIDDDGAVDISYSRDPNFSQLQISNYIAEFCRLNHLTN